MFAAFYSGSKTTGKESFVGVFEDAGNAWDACRHVYGVPNDPEGLKQHYEVVPYEINTDFADYTDEALSRDEQVAMVVRDLELDVTQTDYDVYTKAASELLKRGYTNDLVRMVMNIFREGAADANRNDHSDICVQFDQAVVALVSIIEEKPATLVEKIDTVLLGLKGEIICESYDIYVDIALKWLHAGASDRNVNAIITTLNNAASVASNDNNTDVMDRFDSAATAIRVAYAEGRG